MSGDDRERELQRGLAALPEPVRRAVLARDLDGLKRALTELAPAEAAFTVGRLQELGILATGPGKRDEAAICAEFEPLIQDIVAVASGREERRGVVEQVLAGLEEMGFGLSMPVGRILEGERDAARLTAELPVEETAIVRRVLWLLGS